MEFLDKHRLFVYGGWDPEGEEEDGEPKFYKDGAVLNTLNMQWETVEFKDSFPKNGIVGAGQTSAMVETEGKVQELMAFGGRGGDDLLSQTWRLQQLTSLTRG